MPFATITQGGPPPEEDIADGVYEMVLTGISEPKTVTAKRGKNAGQDFDLLDWTFAIVDGDFKDRELTDSTSTASGPKSKMYAWITALLGGRPPAVGQQFEKTDLVGRLAYGTVAHDEGGWPRISNLGAMPAVALSRNAAKSLNLQPAAAPAPQPLREAVGGNVPF